MASDDPLFFTEKDVHALLRFDALIPAIEQALIDFSSGKVIQPVRTILSLPEQAGHLAWFGLMPAQCGDFVGAKLVTFYPGNATRSLPTHNATIVLFRADTGQPVAVLDGRLITEMRTAAVSAVATRALTAPSANKLAILGSGVQARSHLEALRLVRDFTEVTVWSRNPDRARLFAEEARAIVASTAAEAVRDADVIVTVTSAAEPILSGEWLKPGAYVNAVGGVGLARRELDASVFTDAAVVVESRDAALQESGEIVTAGTRVHAEIGELLSGAKRLPPANRIVFKSLGIAVEDITAAALVYTARVSAG
ncbi:MAG: ornithine cyclodeaminase family protein [Bryobacteraceae bacterium]